MLSTSHADLIRASCAELTIRTPRRRLLIKEELLHDLWDNYADGLPIEQFLEDAAFLNDDVMLMLYAEENLAL